MSDIFTHEDLDRRLMLGRRMSEFILFRQNESSGDSLVTTYFSTYEHTPEDEQWVRRFFSQQPVTKEDVFTTIEKLEELKNNSPTITLHISRVLPEDSIARIGMWLRKHLNPAMLIRFKYDTSVTAGCGISWKGVYTDFSLSHRLEEKHDQIVDLIKLTV